MTYYAMPGIPRSDRQIREITIEDIADIACKYYNIPRDRIFTKSRKRDLTLARSMIYRFSKFELDMRLVNIAQVCGGKDHTTVIHGLKTLQDRIDTEDKIKADVDAIYGKIMEMRFAG